MTGNMVGIKKIATAWKKVFDKNYVPMYNNICVTERDASYLTEAFGLWRNTQEAEEAPLLRV